MRDNCKFILLPKVNSKYSGMEFKNDPLIEVMYSLIIYVYIYAILLLFRYAVPDTPLSIAANVGRDELNTLINTLIQEAGNVESNDVIQFEFLVLNEFLRYVPCSGPIFYLFYLKDIFKFHFKSFE